MGVRNGSLTRVEATRLRAESRQIAQFEYRYRRTNGLQGWERNDLDRRFDNLSRKIRMERHDRDDRRRPGPGYGYGPGAAYESDRDGRPDRVDRFPDDPRRWQSPRPVARRAPPPSQAGAFSIVTAAEGSQRP